MRHTTWCAAAAVLLAASAAGAEVVIEQWSVDGLSAHPKSIRITPAGEDGPGRIEIELGLGKGTKIHRASLLVERELITGTGDDALVDAKVYPAGRTGRTTPPKLEAPWFNSLDVTEAVAAWANSPSSAGSLVVEALPGWQPDRTRLEVVYEGKAGDVPGQVKGVAAIHRSGQTFLTWREVEDKIGAAPATWGRIQALQKEMDAAERVRYLVFRHTAPITAANIAQAELLARVAPLSGYNTRGRSVEELIATVRRRAINNIPLSRKLADDGLNFSPDSPEMAEVVVKTFAIEDGKPLPRDAGLYVHQPAAAGQAHYAVVAAVNGTANLRDLSPANTAAVAETVGPGRPVRQEPADVKVFYDYPGTRNQYVQWTAPPLSNLPNQYYNWSIYIPNDPPKPTPVRIAFVGDQYIKPGTRHRRDTILISGQDQPFWTGWYGYHESFGTLKSFREGTVQPYTQRRMFAFIDWVVETFQGDPKRLSAVGGTEALELGVKHGDKFAYVLANSPDPDPKVTPARMRIQGYDRRPPRPQREAVWGKVEWNLPGPSGKPVWEEFDLIRYVAEDPKRELAFLSMGPAMLSAPWASQVKFMKTLWETRQGFTARFYWGGGEYLPIPEGPVGTKEAFDFALDLPYLALRSNSNDMGLTSNQWTTSTPAYGSGGRIAD
ncbi:MAG TPA: hypothetical protein VM389_00460, partial [Phycisphaerae bacterium]|nr:hypothetical protein [Phycisphaerae bacterium]